MHIPIVVIRYKGFADPVNYRFGHHRSTEAVCVTNNPCCHNSTSATTRHVKLILIDVALSNDCINCRDKVIVIVARVIVIKQIAKLFPIASTASWV